MVITGSSRGLGRGFAAAAAAEGASVIVNGTNEAALNETAEAIRAAGGNVAAVPGSVAEPAVAEALVETCVERFGGIDVIVNNAGIVRDRTLLKMTVAEWDAVIEVHLRGAFLCTQQAALAMREAGGGHIIQVISASGLVGGFGQGNYAAAKEGMIGLMRTALLEFSRFNIRNNALWPIGQTDMTQVVFERARAAAAQQGEPAPDPVAMGFGTPEEVAGQASALDAEPAAGLDWPNHPSGAVRFSVRTPPSSLRGIVDRLDPGWRYLAQFGVGEVTVAADAVGLEELEELRGRAESLGGALVMLDAPASVARAFDPWGTPPPSVEIQRRVVNLFDPGRRINRGILPGRI